MPTTPAFRLLAPFVFSALLAAQDKAPARLTARDFFPPDHTNVAAVDFVRLRSTGVWDDLEVSVLKPVFLAMEKEIGFPLARLDRITAIARMPYTEPGGMSPLQIDNLFVFEGNGALPLSARDRSIPEAEPIGGYAVRQRRGGQDILVYPAPELRVEGASSIVEPVLSGKPWRGQPAADLQSLLSGRGDNLAWFVIETANPLLRDRTLVRVLGEVDWPEGDGPQFLMVRARAIGDKDDPHVQVEAVVRHGKPGPGLEKSTAAVQAFLKKMTADPRFATLKAALAKAEVKVQGGDVTASLDLGRSRDAVGTLAVLALPILMPATLEAQEVPPAHQPQGKQ